MNILAVGCHPDDLEIGCGGTLIRYARGGHRVFVVTVANGDLGHVIHQPPELARIRFEETKRGAEAMGAVDARCLGVGDLLVESSKEETARKLTRVIREVRPDLIITHDPNDYMRDHVEVSQLVFDASFSATVPHYEPDCPAYPVFAPIFYMDTLAGINFLPEEYVDISGEIDAKLSALACHDSQIGWMREHDNVDFLDFVRTCSKFRGLQCGAAYAEGFRSCRAWPRQLPKRLLP